MAGPLDLGKRGSLACAFLSIPNAAEILRVGSVGYRRELNIDGS